MGIFFYNLESQSRTDEMNFVGMQVNHVHVLFSTSIRPNKDCQFSSLPFTYYLLSISIPSALSPARTLAASIP